MKTAFWVDLVLIVAVALLETVPLTGLSLHEWLGAVIAVILIGHILLSWRWVEMSFRRLSLVGSWRTRVNVLLNFSLFAAAVAVILSGFLLSEVVARAVGIHSMAGDIRWRYIHNRFSNYFFILAGLHLGLNWEWCVSVVRRWRR